MVSGPSNEQLVLIAYAVAGGCVLLLALLVTLLRRRIWPVFLGAAIGSLFGLVPFQLLGDRDPYGEAGMDSLIVLSLPLVVAGAAIGTGISAARGRVR